MNSKNKGVSKKDLDKITKKSDDHKSKKVLENKKKPQKKDVDLKVVEQSLNMTKSLNEQIAKVAKIKDSLKDDLEKLNKRVENHEKKTSQKSVGVHNNFLSTIKEEIINEFAPLMNKFDIKSIKVDIFEEIKKVIEIESQKLKSELDSKNTKTKKDFSKKLSDLEIRILESLNANNSIREQVKKLENNNYKGLNEEIEKKVSDSIKKINDKFFTLFSSSTIDIDELKENNKKLEKRLDSLKKNVKSNFSIEDLNLSSIESKIKKLEDQNMSLKSMIEKFENDLYNRKKAEVFEVETRVKKDLEKTKSKLKEIDDLKLEQQKALENKFDEISKFVLDMQDKVISLEKKDMSDIDKKTKEMLNRELILAQEKLRDLFLKKQKDIDFNLKNFEEEISILVIDAKTKLDTSFIKIEREREMLLDDVSKSKHDMIKSLEDKFNDLSIRFDIKVNPLISTLNKDKNKYREDIDKFKTEISNLVKKYVSELDKELKILKSSEINFKKEKRDALKEIDTRFTNQITSFSKEYTIFSKNVSDSMKLLEKEKGLEREYLANKYNEIVLKFEELLENNKDKFKEEKEILVQEVRDEISKQILNDTNHLNKITQENKDEILGLKEMIESKFSIAKEQFESSFVVKLSNFDNELKNKEQEFLEKLSIIEIDKNKMVDELSVFKDEISTLTKNYVNSLDEELKKIKVEEAKFEREVEEFGLHVQDIVKARKLELLDYSQNLEKELYEILKNQKENFDRNEASFRETFNEKISNLKEYTENKLDSIEKRFVEKNLKYVTDKLDKGMQDLEVYNQRLKTKESEILTKFEEFDAIQQNSYVEINAEKEKLKEEIEERLMGLEKRFNKRFIDYGSEISSFKGVIIDEVEDLIKEVNQVLSKRLEKIDISFAKFNFINNELKLSLDKIKEIDNKVESQFSLLRDDISDIRVKFELTNNAFSHTINDHVQYMSAYEEQLIGLIENLKFRGVSNEQIMKALANKGHPKFYVGMILNNYNNLVN